MSNPLNVARPAAAASLMLIVRTMLLAIPLITVALWFVLAADGLGPFPPVWAPLVVVAAAVGGYSVCELIGFRTAPLEHGGRPADVEAESWRRFTSSTFLRFAICEAVFLISLPLGFLVDSFWVVLIGAVLAIPLVTLEVLPGARNQQRFAASLEARGVPSYLTGRPQDY
ncbi:hypothetical protein BWI15_24090 [Kribbella sp. ALI-6-A]|uniref:hypothetical protein n=1 Tax=Kribbella sp. ALI-6-A TaxID=1933817 RepID=UPI00097BB6EE|nr:hypothetical protein [Kribbella sp. ALI-6-A]ONI69640.1 hypothetical protein BWI15_24090 [Kribbella sp. ALI-6-A]